MSRAHIIKYLYLLILPLVAMSTWYSIVIFKGYSPLSITESVLLGKNLALTEKYSLDNEYNVLLSPEKIKNEGQISPLGNKLTAVFYSKVFKTFGVLSWNNLVLLSVFLHALALLIFTFLVFKLFGFKISFIFSLIYIFLPFNWQVTHHLGMYEFAMPFVATFFLFLFWAEKTPENKTKYAFLVLSGVFLALSGLTKEVFFLIIPGLALYLFFSKKKKELALILIPVFIILSCFYLPSAIKNGNIYLKWFSPKDSIQEQSADINLYGHIDTDPYTFYFDKENFLKNYQTIKSGKDGTINAIQIEKLAKNMNIDKISFWSRIKINLFVISNHLTQFFSLETIGGPIMLLFAILGFIYLKKKQKELTKLILYWSITTFFILSFVVLAGRQHLMDFGWIIALLISFGIIHISSVVSKHFEFYSKKNMVILGTIFLAILYHLILANHVYWGRAYDSKHNLAVMAYTTEIENQNIPNNAIVAVGTNYSSTLAINYFSDKSLVMFKTQTIEKLISENKLIDGFEKLGVTHMLGYDEKLSQQIMKNSNAQNIASDNIEIKNTELTGTKSWLVNLIR